MSACAPTCIAVALVVYGGVQSILSCCLQRLLPQIYWNRDITEAGVAVPGALALKSSPACAQCINTSVPIVMQCAHLDCAGAHLLLSEAP